jgi:hypothetical protein
MAAPTFEIALPAVRVARQAALRSALPYLASAALVLPLFALALWSGFRIGLSDSVLAAIAASEQPLSVRTPGSMWTLALALVWFALAYRRRDAPLWQAALVVLGGLVVLLRAGNAWLDGLALIVPLGAQLSALRLRPVFLYAAAVVGFVVAGQTLWSTRPPVLPQAAIQAAQSSAEGGTVFADWRWATELQQHVDDRVWAAGGVGSESTDFWLDYVRITQDHERWSTELRDMDANLVVLSDDQVTLEQQVRASSQWHVLYDAGNAFVAERVSA